MAGLANLRPGDIGFGPISGGAGLLVSAGQLLLGEGFRIGHLDIRHVFVVTEALHDEGPSAEWPTGVINSGRLVEAEPGGAQENPITLERWTSRHAYVRIPEDYPGQASDAARIARLMIGTPYSFASYAALAAWRLGWKTPRLERWIDRRRDVTGPERALPAEAICSVLADQAWTLAGKKVMQGVAHQCVTPGALAARLLEMDGARWFWPGESS